MKHWCTNRGEWLKIKNMETSHIRNCIRLIENGKLTRPLHVDRAPYLRKELIKRYYEATKSR